LLKSRTELSMRSNLMPVFFLNILCVNRSTLTRVSVALRVVLWSSGRFLHMACECPNKIRYSQGD
jgi:hypothetical protein